MHALSKALSWMRPKLITANSRARHVCHIGATAICTSRQGLDSRYVCSAQPGDLLTLTLKHLAFLQVTCKPSSVLL